MKTTINVTGMSCQHCANRVRAAIVGVPGVASASVDLAGARVEVECDPTVTVDSLVAAVTDAGYGASA